jgi:hypothetical protein
MGRTIVAIKPSSSSTGASGVTRYIAESKRDPEREHLKDKEARPLFSADRDGLSFQQADEILAQGKGWLPEKEDVIHLVISLESESFEQLGDTHEERTQAFQDIIRDAAGEIEKEVDVYELRFVAGIHLNTDNPHAHLAISRQAIDRSTHEPKHINHLPRTLLPHHEKTPAGGKEFKAGLIAESVNRGIDLTREALRQRGLQIHLEDSQSRTRFEPQTEIAERGLTLGSEPDHTIETTTSDIERFAPSTTEACFTPDTTKALEPSAEISAPHQLPQPTGPPTGPPAGPPIEPPTELIVPTAAGMDHTAPDTSFGPLPELPETVFQPNALDSEPRRLDSLDRVQKERETLGRSMLARAEVERLESELQSINDHGDKRRFRVFDSTHGRTRQISEFDIHRRADARAARTVRERTITDRDQRHLARQIHYERELHYHDRAIHDHQIIVSKTIKKIGRDLGEATALHASLKAQVRAIQTHYKALGGQMPVPLLSRDELAKLQDQAVASQNSPRVKTLENIRQSLALEHDKPTRVDEEIARLEGQLLMSRAEQAARHERAHQFERNKHQTRWEIKGEKYSLAELDRTIAEKQNRSRFFGFPLRIKTIHLIPSERRAAAAAAERFKEVRETVLAKIEQRKQDLRSSLDQSVRMTQTLTEIHTREQESQQARGGERLDKILTHGEISQLIEHASTLSDSSMLQQAYILEAQYYDRQSPDKQPPLTEQAAKAAGREVVTEIMVREADKKVAAFNEHKDFVPVIVTDLDGSLTTGCLADFHEPRHPIKWLLHRIAETHKDRHLRQQLTRAVDAETAQLREELSNALQCHELTKRIADSYREHFHSVGETMPEPTFTARQIIQLEIYAVRHPDQPERQRIESLIKQAELSHHVFTPQARDSAQPPRSDVSDELRRNDPGNYQMRDHHHSNLSVDGHQPAAPCPPQNQRLEPADSSRLDQTGPTQDNPDLDILH